MKQDRPINSLPQEKKEHNILNYVVKFQNNNDYKLRCKYYQRQGELKMQVQNCATFRSKYQLSIKKLTRRMIKLNIYNVLDLYNKLTSHQNSIFLNQNVVKLVKSGGRLQIFSIQLQFKNSKKQKNKKIETIQIDDDEVADNAGIEINRDQNSGNIGIDNDDGMDINAEMDHEEHVQSVREQNLMDDNQPNYDSQNKNDQSLFLDQQKYKLKPMPFKIIIKTYKQNTNKHEQSKHLQKDKQEQMKASLIQNGKEKQKQRQQEIHNQNEGKLRQMQQNEIELQMISEKSNEEDSNPRSCERNQQLRPPKKLIINSLASKKSTKLFGKLSKDQNPRSYSIQTRSSKTENYPTIEEDECIRQRRKTVNKNKSKQGQQKQQKQELKARIAKLNADMQNIGKQLISIKQFHQGLYNILMDSTKLMFEFYPEEQPKLSVEENQTSPLNSAIYRSKMDMQSPLKVRDGTPHTKQSQVFEQKIDQSKPTIKKQKSERGPSIMQSLSDDESI